ncbi:class I SAM-dependent methyltransferase [Phytoactinopolyspora alkaliphila]|uniref:Class I SAM-dependent methyltransferase n=1 Tax=Phytoactinopolyspora alkaliphila TaxID=1783498 RepID=A0A6N9YT44_9ACTN|nr:class I SAM-dependent methyltransferase [Phytoactinopolyspora alkaliphila]NED98135.1 class I SAM-dependent methyltransferase [Phytoactinopolyspora alkaliphila]
MPLARDHPDRIRWNARFKVRRPVFDPHPLAVFALETGFLPGPVLELACGPSGSALALAAAGRDVVAVDISDVALAQLAAEAERRDLAERIDCVLADLTHYDAGPERFALVLATRFWDEAAFRSGCRALLPGGLVGWEALTGRVGDDARHERAWYVEHGGLSARLPEGFEVLREEAHGSARHHATRILARRGAAPGASE